VPTYAWTPYGGSGGARRIVHRGRDWGRRRRSNRFVEPNPTDLETGNGRQGHSWVRIPPPPLRSATNRIVERNPGSRHLGSMVAASAPVRLQFAVRSGFRSPPTVTSAELVRGSRLGRRLPRASWSGGAQADKSRPWEQLTHPLERLVKVRRSVRSVASIASQFTDASGAPAWKHIPSWSLIGTLDHVIPPPLQTEMASRAGSHTRRIRAGHVSLVTRPGAVTRMILSAVNATM